MRDDGATRPCPVRPYDRAEAGYSESVLEWLANPNAFFRAFGSEAREFQKRHRSERLRTMTLVAPAEKLVALRPVCICVDRSPIGVESWEEAFSLVTLRLAKNNPRVFEALQSAGELEWLGCAADSEPMAEVLAANSLCPQFGSIAEVIGRIQWLFLMCGIRLNEVIVQVDPYTDEEWVVRKAQLRDKRDAERRYLADLRAAGSC